MKTISQLKIIFDRLNSIMMKGLFIHAHICLTSKSVQAIKDGIFLVQYKKIILTARQEQVQLRTIFRCIHLERTAEIWPCDIWTLAV